MAFPKSQILSARSLSRLIKEATENNEQRFCFILGSGASVESGIPSGSTLEMQWMDCLMGKLEDRGMPAMDEDETRRLASDLYEEKKIKHKFNEIEMAWQRAKKKAEQSQASTILISTSCVFMLIHVRGIAIWRESWNIVIPALAITRWQSC